ncbi:unnamed protein product [Mesocestoides corti]|uniref:RRM domain-containing protein n=1 Tax=Mesocestoides corti TaxID=53468 RepID=A0A0R3UG49_MESCO|nr:unnamed protein product [Mesocestoides corti]
MRRLGGDQHDSLQTREGEFREQVFCIRFISPSKLPTDVASSKGVSAEEAKKRIYVGHLPLYAHRDDLVKYFSAYGTVETAFVAKTKGGIEPRFFGFVYFSRPEDVEKVLAFPGTHRIRGQAIIVKAVQPDYPLVTSPNPSIMHANACYVHLLMLVSFHYRFGNIGEDILIDRTFILTSVNSSSLSTNNGNCNGVLLLLVRPYNCVMRSPFSSATLIFDKNNVILFWDSINTCLHMCKTTDSLSLTRSLTQPRSLTHA